MFVMERTYLDHLDELTGRILREASSMSVFCRAHPLEAVRPMLARMGIITAWDLRRVKAGEIVLSRGFWSSCHASNEVRQASHVHHDGG